MNIKVYPLKYLLSCRKSTKYLCSIILFLSTFPQTLFSQQGYKPLNYGKILPYEERISGSFGELRNNHFHAGLDFKTNETEGMPVFCAAPGYISRIKTSSSGYGRVIYVTHPDSIVTVYGHLRAFYPSIEDTIRKLQESKKSFEVEMFPAPGFYTVKAKQVIGFSGNSGSSEGPHVHFETRIEKNEKPFNPVFKGYFESDTIPPVFKSLVIYQPGNYLGLYGANRNFYDCDSTTFPDTIIAGENLFFGFEAFDKAGKEINELGIRSFALFINDSLMFASSIDSFLFEETKMINAAIDYKMKSDSGKVINLCYKMPGNKLPFYGKGNGLISLKAGSVYKIRLAIQDSRNNSTDLKFYINCRKLQNRIPKSSGMEVAFGKAHEIATKKYNLKVYENSFYENGKINLRTDDTLLQNRMSSTIIIDVNGMAIKEPLSLKLFNVNTRGIAESKIVAYQVDQKGNVINAGGFFSGKDYIIRVRNTGSYFLGVDTISPVALAPIFKEDDFTGSKKIIIPLKSDFSGINTFECYLNGGWAFAEYNTNRNEIIIYLQQRHNIGSSLNISLSLTDGRFNESSFTYNLNHD